jgi:sulfur relay (sulfurtransferase) complex TusBCD TusD component (DsrE family)
VRQIIARTIVGQKRVFNHGLNPVQREAIMADFLFVLGTGPHDPSKPTRCMMVAQAAKQKGHNVDIFLTDEAVIFGKKGMAKYVVSMAGDEMGEYLDYLIEQKVPVHVCRPCAEVRHLRDEELIETAQFQDADKLVSLAENARVFNF